MFRLPLPILKSMDLKKTRSNMREKESRLIVYSLVALLGILVCALVCNVVAGCQLVRKVNTSTPSTLPPGQVISVTVGVTYQTEDGESLKMEWTESFEQGTVATIY